MTTLRLEEVSSPTDPRLDVFRNIRAEDAHGADGGFIGEGAVTLATILSAPTCPLTTVLVARETAGRFAHVLSQVPEDVPVLVIPHSLMNQVTGFEVSHSVLSYGRRPSLPLLPELIEQGLGDSTTFLVLEGLIHEENVGVCFRNAAALGVAAILMDESCCDPLHRRAVRISVGHALRVPWTRAPINDILEQLEQHSVCRAALTTEQHAERIESFRRPAGRLALVLGSEAAGVSGATLRRCELNLRIPLAGGVDSLNVAVAGAIGLFALRDPTAFESRTTRFERRQTLVESDETPKPKFGRVPTKLEGVPE